MAESKCRCQWCLSSDLMIAYHDNEWGTPVRDDRELFEHLTLDGFQAGLSWSTVLNKRENFRLAFDNFSPEIIAKYDEAKIQELMQNPGIIRNKLKILATINNAQLYLDYMQRASFAELIWSFSGGKTIHNSIPSGERLPATSPESDMMSKELKKLGFSFVGSTICYAFMQAVGIINDHSTDCFRYSELNPRNH